MAQSRTFKLLCVTLLSLILSLAADSRSAGLSDQVSVKLVLSDSTYLVGQDVLAEVTIVNLTRDTLRIPAIDSPKTSDFIGNNGIEIFAQHIHVDGRGTPTTLLAPSETLVFVSSVSYHFLPHPDTVANSHSPAVSVGSNRVHFQIGGQIKSNEASFELVAPAGDEFTVYSKIHEAFRVPRVRDWSDKFDKWDTLIREYPETRYKRSILRRMIECAQILDDDKRGADASTRFLMAFPDDFEVGVGLHQLKWRLPKAEYQQFLKKLISEFPGSRAERAANVALSKE